MRNNEENITVFNKETYYNNEIAEKVKELKKLCNKEKIPMFLSICIKNNKKGSVYVNEMIGTVSNNIRLKQDYFADYVNIQNGFNTTPNKQIEEYNF